MPSDHVHHIAEQWSRERPDLDFSPIRTIARVSRLARLLERRIEDTFNEFGLAKGGFDVLAALKRSGPPYRLSPSGLYRSFLISSGAMTNRLDRLEEAGLVTRMPDPYDRRGILVGLTPRGHKLIDAAVEAHLANERRLLTPLTEDEQRDLVRLLLKLLLPLESEPRGFGENLRSGASPEIPRTADPATT